MKKILILISIFLLTGCNNYQELNHMAIIKGAAIDIIDNQFIISYAISSKNNETNIIKGKGKNIAEAISEMSLVSSKELYIGHMLVLIVSEDVAKNGLKNVIDYFFRNPVSKKTFQLIVAKNEKASKILETISPLDSFSSDNISRNLTSENSLETFVINTTLLSFLKNIKDPGIEPVINGITIKNNDEKYIKIEPLAIFKNDKLIKWVDKDISKGISILYNQSTSTKINTKCKNSNITFTMNDIKIKKEFTFDTNLNLKVKIEGNTTIDEMNCNYNLKNISDLKKIEDILTKSLENILLKTTNEIKNSKIDSIGIGFYLYQNYYEYFIKNQNHYLDNLKISFEIKPNLLANENANEGVN